METISLKKKLFLASRGIKRKLHYGVKFIKNAPITSHYSYGIFLNSICLASIRSYKENTRHENKPLHIFCQNKKYYMNKYFKLKTLGCNLQPSTSFKRSPDAFFSFL